MHSECDLSTAELPLGKQTSPTLKSNTSTRNGLMALQKAITAIKMIKSEQCVMVKPAEVK